MRAPTSAAPPGGNGTIRRTGLFGYCACAPLQRTARATLASTVLMSIPVGRINGVDLALERRERVLAGALLGRPALAHRLRKNFGPDRAHRARAACCDLNVASALHGPEHQESFRHARPPGEQP